MATEDPVETSYDSLEELLTSAAARLDAAASLIRDLRLNPDVNIAKIGESLVKIFQFQHEIYAIRPDLRPGFLDDNHSRSRAKKVPLDYRLRTSTIGQTRRRNQSAHPKKECDE